MIFKEVKELLNLVNKQLVEGKSLVAIAKELLVNESTIRKKIKQERI